MCFKEILTLLPCFILGKPGTGAPLASFSTTTKSSNAHTWCLLVPETISISDVAVVPSLFVTVYGSLKEISVLPAGGTKYWLGSNVNEPSGLTLNVPSLNLLKSTSSLTGTSLSHSALPHQYNPAHTICEQSGFNSCFPCAEGNTNCAFDELTVALSLSTSTNTDNLFALSISL